MVIKEKLVDAALERYRLPIWLKPYALSYLKGANSLGAIKHAASFIDIGRRKGTITKTEVVLPNGTTFKREQVLHLASLFFYGEERMSEMSKMWASAVPGLTSGHKTHFISMAAIEAKRARAIKSLIQGLGNRPVAPTRELVELFDYVERLHSWEDIMITKKILLYNSFAMPFGYVFYRIFYPVSPEFMRSFGTAFNTKQPEEMAGEEEACRIIEQDEISRERLIYITENVLARIAKAVDAEMKNAKKAGIEREAVLLRDISIAYPLHRLEELGVNLDIEKEIATVKRMSRLSKLS